MKPQVFTLRTDRDAQRLWAFLKHNWQALAKEGGPLDVIVYTHKAKRSTEQNKYYWRLLKIISEDAWVEGKQYSADTWHEFMKRRFIGVTELPGGAECGISTTTLSVAEFADYAREVENYAQIEIGLQLVY